MEFWFSEMHTDNVKASIRCEKQLYSGQSDFQRIDVFDSAEFGRFLVSNGSVIFSEKDDPRGKAALFGAKRFPAH